MTIPSIVTIDNALSHLHLSSEDDDLQLKIDAATQLVCEHIADRQPADEDWIAEIEAWDEDSAPPIIRLAVLEQVGEFYRFRGDDMASDRPPVLAYGSLSSHVMAILHRYRSPTLA
jgi:hypothetical protein